MSGRRTPRSWERPAAGVAVVLLIALTAPTAPLAAASPSLQLSSVIHTNPFAGTSTRMQDGEGGTYTSVKQGGGQIEFEDEDPQIHKDFEAAMKEVGARCNMGGYHPGCTVR